jgi:hypothetical protein
MRARAHSRDEGGFGRVAATSLVMLAMLSGIVLMVLGAVGHMATLPSPSLANLGSPVARERHLAERRHPESGFAALGSGAASRSSSHRSHDGQDAVGDGSMTLDELRASLRGDVTTDVSWSDRSDTATGASLGSKPRRRWPFGANGRDEKKGESRAHGKRHRYRNERLDEASKTRGDDDLLDVMKRGYREAEEAGLSGKDTKPYDPATVDAETEYRTKSGRARLETKFINPRALNSTADTGRLRRLGRTLYLDGEPWLMRALCYSPIPVGWDPDWFEPYGDFFTSEFAGIYERDIPLMAAAGVNTLRVYTQALAQTHALLRFVPQVRYRRRGWVRVR